MISEVLNQQIPMQLVVCGRCPSSEAIIESLAVLIAAGADVNYVPPASKTDLLVVLAINFRLIGDASAPLLRDPVPYMAAIHTEPEVLKFLFEQGADFKVHHPAPHMNQRSVLNQSSFVNAFTIQKLLDPASVQPSLSFTQQNYPAHYRHQLAMMKLDWVHFIGDAHLKSTLVNLLQSRVINTFNANPLDRARTYGSRQKTEISFELQLNSADSKMTPVTLEYVSDVAHNGSEDFTLTVSMPRDGSSAEQIAVKFRYDLNAFHGTLQSLL